MTTYSTYDHATQEREEFYALAPAKKWMKERINLGHEVSGSITKIYSNGDWVPCGPISLTGINKAFIANTRMTNANY